MFVRHLSYLQAGHLRARRLFGRLFDRGLSASVFSGILFFSNLFFGATISRAQGLPPPPSAWPTPAPSPTLEELEERIRLLEAQTQPISALTEDVARLRLEREVPAPVAQEFNGQGPAMSKAYFSREPLSIGAVADTLYEARDGQPDYAGVPLARAFLGYRLASYLQFHSAWLLESASPSRTTTSPSPESGIILDFLYLDWLWQHGLTLRAGLVPVPLGLRRLRPEPTLYADPLRPRIEEWCVPSDFSRPGLLLLFQDGEEDAQMRVQVGVITSLEAQQYQTGQFIAGSASRRLAPEAFQAADRASLVVRVEAQGGGQHTHWLLGAAHLSGDTGSNSSGISHAYLTLTQAHFRLKTGPIEIMALGVVGDLGGTDTIYRVTEQRPGSTATGGWIELRAAILESQRPASLLSAGIFGSGETLHLTGLRPSGAPLTTPDSSTGQAVRAGLYVRPIPNVILQGAYQWAIGQQTLDTDLWLAAMGLVF